MKDLRYLAAFSLPLSALLSIKILGYWSYFTVIYAFVLIPIFELLLPVIKTNLSEDEIEVKKNKKLFDALLLFNLPIIYGLVVYAVFTVTTKNLSTIEFVGLVLSVGIVLGTNGINVAHELGHRKSLFMRVCAKLLLLPSFYMHFYIEHNFGHHAHAATPEDPATAKYNQTVYSFWLTSVTKQYYNAWRIQRNLLKKANARFFSIQHDMLWYTLLQIGYLVIAFAAFDVTGLYFALGTGIVGFLLLESVNYIEHYGLLRNIKPSGRYEPVKEIHSWNSNHLIGRIILYELTRHSDHHYRASKKYQLLNYHEISPQMPYGYPTSIVLSFFPPLWFKIMNKRIPKSMLPKQ